MFSVLRSIVTLTAVIVFVSLPAHAQSFSFTNSAPITINDNTTGTPYPSTIGVPAICCGFRITKASVTLNGYSHTFPDDVGFLLVAPGGQKIRLMTDVGGDADITNLNITIDDAATAFAPDTAVLTSTSYKPTAGTSAPGGSAHPANFPAPAPAAPYSTLLSDLIGTTPGGPWSLYVDDDSGVDIGTLSGGWTLTLRLGQTFTSAAGGAIPTGPGPAAVYPISNVVSGVTGSVTRVTVRLNGLTHSRLDDVGILLVGPGGQTVRLTSDNGSDDNAAGDYVFDSTVAATIPDAGVAGTVIVPTTYGPSPDGADNGGSAAMPANFVAPAPAGPYGGNLNVYNGLNPNGTWNLYVYDDTAVDAGTIANWTLLIETLSPSAGGVSISGRVVNSEGRGIGRTFVTLTGGTLEHPIHAISNPFGYYRLPNAPAGSTYIVSVSHKQYLFAQPDRVVNAAADITDLDFVALP